jgi:hypothetical protein
VGGEQRPRLRQRLDDQDAGHHGMAREVAVEERFVARHQLAGDDRSSPISSTDRRAGTDSDAEGSARWR